MNNSIRRLYLTVAGGFVVLILLLGYWQVVAAGDLNDRPDNPYTVQRERLIDRGRIISADGVTLALSRPRRVRGQRIFERRYPMGDLAPHLVGYASPQQGKTGLESTWNRFLAGSYGTEPLLQRLNLSEKRGADVRITLDTRVQRAAVEALGGRAGAVVALDPRTGAVLAMASEPRYDLNDVLTRFDQLTRAGDSLLLNRAVGGRYAPGSTFKVVTATAALESGLYTPESRFDDTGSLAVPGPDITNFGQRTWGEHDLTFALTNSINTTFARIGQALGPQQLGGQMGRYGFGERPAIDLPEGEVTISGRYRDGRLVPNDEEGEDAARIAIGQEQLGVAPLQMAMVAAAVANGGTLYRPFIMRSIVDRGGGVVREQGPQEIGQVSGPDTATALNVMMRRVVQEGTGTAAALTGLEVAGKTGTAETGRPDGSNHAWFIGFAPAVDPRVAVAVVIEGTQGTGGVEAAPVAAAVMRAAIAAGGP